MRTRYSITLIMIASLMVGGQALAQPQLPTFQSGDAIKANDLNRVVEQIRRNTSALDGIGGATHTVDCGAGETIANAMSQAHPGATIMIWSFWATTYTYTASLERRALTRRFRLMPSSAARRARLR